MAHAVSRKATMAKIHIAKKQLGLDDSLYRSILKDASGKDSCKEMSLSELMLCLKQMENLGFKAKAPTSKGQSSLNTNNKALGKMTAIWITMHQQGFINDGSDKALNVFVKKQTAHGQVPGVDSIRFLKPSQASQMLEILKKWHIRVMLKALSTKDIHTHKKTYDDICSIYNADVNKGQNA